MTGSTATRTDHKAWAREQIKGVEGVVHPSFTPDFAALDAEGVRHDVRQSIAQGVFSIFTSAAGLTHDEYKHILRIVREEAGTRALTSAVIRGRNLEENADLLAHAEKIGCSHVLFWLPEPPSDVEAMVEMYRSLITTTSMAVFLYAHRLPSYKAMHPSGVAIPVLDKLADLPNVVAVKLTQTLDPVADYQVCDALSDRVLCGPADLSVIPVLARTFPIQWTGQFLIEAMQSVDRPYLTDFMRVLNDGDIDRATERYWKLAPAARAFNDVQREFLLRGSHPWTHLKYYQWLTGGNGGLLRAMHDESTPLDATWRERIALNLRDVGIPLTDHSLDEFVVGAEQYARGKRPRDMAATPCWA